MEEKFGELGELERVMIVTHPSTKDSRGFGFVTFKDAEAAKQGLEKYNNTELYGNQMRIEFAKRSEPRRKTPGRYLGSSRNVQPSQSSRYSRPYDRYDRNERSDRYDRYDRHDRHERHNRDYDRPRR